MSEELDDYENGEELDLSGLQYEAERAGRALGRLLAAALIEVFREIDLNHIIREELADNIRDAVREEIEPVIRENKLLILSALGGAIPSALEEKRGKKKT